MFKKHTEGFYSQMRKESILLAAINQRKRAGQRVTEQIDDCSPFFMQPDANEEWGYREKKFRDQNEYDEDLDKRES